MTPGSVPDGVKPTLPRPRHGGYPGPSDPDLSEELLAGRRLPPDAPAAYADVALLLTALSGAPSEAETVDEWKAIAAFRAAKDHELTAPTRARAPRRKTMISALISAKVLATMTAAAATVGGTAAVAYTGNLPAPVQHLASATIGAPAAEDPADTDAPETDAPESTDATKAGQDEAADADAADAAEVDGTDVDGTEVDATETDATETEAPAERAVAPSPVGPDATGPAAFGLCNAWTKGGLGAGSIAFRNLTTAAGAGGIQAYCATVEHPGGKPVDRPSKAPKHPTGKPTKAPSTHDHAGKPKAATSAAKPGKPGKPAKAASTSSHPGKHTRGPAPRG